MQKTVALRAPVFSLLAKNLRGRLDAPLARRGLRKPVNSHFEACDLAYYWLVSQLNATGCAGGGDKFLPRL